MRREAWIVWWMLLKVCNEWGYVAMFPWRIWWIPLLPDVGKEIVKDKP
jgi:hypothetical protein